MIGLQLQYYIDGVYCNGKRDLLVGGHYSSKIRVVIGMTLVNNVWENVHRRELVLWEI